MFCLDKQDKKKEDGEIKVCIWFHEISINIKYSNNVQICCCSLFSE